MSKLYAKKGLRNVFVFLLFIYSSLQGSTALAAPATWQGPYLGIYLGGGFGSNHLSTNAGSVTDTSYFSNATDINAINEAGSSTNDPNSVIVGLVAGHDWVWKHLVYGLVLDYGALPLNSSNNANNANYFDNSGQYYVSTSMSTNWLFTLRGRVGYEFIHPWPSFIYLTGGPALTQLKVSNNFIDNTSFMGAGSSSSDENEIGWTAGIGMELAAIGHSSVSLEYLYLHVPSVDTVASVTNTQGGFGIPVQAFTSPLATSGAFHANLLKLEFNYRFGE
jgi:outer membrane immunogenic protein